MRYHHFIKETDPAKIHEKMLGIPDHVNHYDFMVLNNGWTALRTEIRQPHSVEVLAELGPVWAHVTENELKVTDADLEPLPDEAGLAAGISYMAAARLLHIHLGKSPPFYPAAI